MSCLVLSYRALSCRVVSCRIVSQLKHYFIPGRCAFPLHLQIYCYTNVNINKEYTNYSTQKNCLKELDVTWGGLFQTQSAPANMDPLCLPHTTNSGSTKQSWTLD